MEKLHKPDLKLARKRSKEHIETKEYQKTEIINLGLGKKYLIQTHGCQANEADTEVLAGLLEDQAFTKTDIIEETDVLIINTCAIRENAENKVFGELGRLKSYKKVNPNMIIAVAGCMPQEEAVVERILNKYKHVDIVFGTHNVSQFIEYLHYVMVEKKRLIEVFSKEGDIIENLPQARDHRFKAWVNIMYGCDEFCTYCIVPYTRGKERSRQKDYIIKEVKNLVKRGYKEITLLGQNVNSYGLDFDNIDYSFANLLEDLAKLDVPRIKFTTSHPKDFSDDIIDIISKYDNIMPFIHLPVQSGSNSVLKKMNRKYTKEEYLTLVEKIYDKIPNVSLTTDIIVAFPSETEDDFKETLDLVEKARFEGAYTFIYSPRKGTPAASYENNISEEEAKSRLYQLNKLVNEGYLRGNKRFEHQTVKVLVEGPSKTRPDVLSGYTENNKLVNFKGPESLVGKIIEVYIEEAKTWSLDGIIKNS
ncbi:tRNA (N6-isopentenyl adenosine(37)-C2)-methylthiotransferase MiaB [Hujiaoplasma nucleasis]|uniref:tRNA-2-methylthio-N(6)-dimethylallyladenosine synthase n=1 Tax=Hujiaoplasma nucleasis TaxID=2725268 RepID=A0A7L6N2S8_9MOLU|nr:tRNA (N6-isopentenyl adenosine(37)-C2)-methylthiotransferase MiaB [Hujiaoplasma nucleasis]QLY39762.1 tRNA (N6-isopentenyl adenosine(37)-C2)-methylthiotransferase MiaB [Hujiaoplasma nucleasis]